MKAFAGEKKAAGSGLLIGSFLLITSIFLNAVSGNVLNAGTAKQKEKNVAVGEVLSSWYRPVLSVTCTWCMRNVVIFAPAVYGAVSASGSDPAVLGDPEYVSGVWTESSAMNGSGCLQLHCVTLRPGTAAVHVDYAACFGSYKDSGGPCPQCGKQVPPVYMNDVWYKYKNYYNVNVYVDYTLTYDANAGEDTVTGLPSPETRREYKDTAGIIVLDEEPEREGYNFLGWSKEAADKASRYEAGNLITLEWKKGAEVGTTLYSVWKKVAQGTDPEEPPAVPDTSEAVPVPSVYEAPAPFDRKRLEVPELSVQTESGGTISEENPLPQTEKRELRPDPRLRAVNPKILLAVHGHRCCILHFAVMLPALLTEAVYTGNMILTNGGCCVRFCETAGCLYGVIRKQTDKGGGKSEKEIFDGHPAGSFCSSHVEDLHTQAAGRAGVPGGGWRLQGILSAEPGRHERPGACCPASGGRGRLWEALQL